MARRPRRQRDQLPTCYFEGYLENRSFRDKTSPKLWTCLCGNALFFFNNMRDSNYVEKLDLSGFISITDDNSPDPNLGAARLNLQLKDANIKLTAPNTEARELWKGYIRAVMELSVPSSLNLLPGQIHMLKSAVEREKERIRNAPPARAPPPPPPAAPAAPPAPPAAPAAPAPPATLAAPAPPAPPAPPAADSSLYLSLMADMPACFYEVSRMEAELLLEKQAHRGNLLLRPGRAGDSFAVSTRQDLDGSIFKHYRVRRKPEGGFIIDVDNPIPCATLHDVIDYLVETTDRVLSPLIIEETYEDIISFVRSDNENGEKSVEHAATNLLPPQRPPKPAALRGPEAEACEEEDAYRNLNDKPETETQDSSAAPVPAPRRSPLPALPVPRKRTSITPSPSPFSSPSSSSTSSSSSPSSSSSRSTDTSTRAGGAEGQGQKSLMFLSELRLKLGQKGQNQE